MIGNSRERFGSGTILLHWLIAVLMVGLIPLGFVMVRMEIDPGLQFSLYQWHKSFGLTVLALALLRIFWRLTNAKTAAAPGLSGMEIRAAWLAHRLLLVLSVAVPLAGWAIASTSTLAIPTLLFDRVLIPHLPMQKSSEAEVMWTTVHLVCAYGLAALVLLHAAATLYHQLFKRDRLLWRMIRSKEPSQ